MHHLPVHCKRGLHAYEYDQEKKWTWNKSDDLESRPKGENEKEKRKKAYGITKECSKGTRKSHAGFQIRRQAGRQGGGVANREKKKHKYINQYSKCIILLLQ